MITELLLEEGIDIALESTKIKFTSQRVQNLK